MRRILPWLLAAGLLAMVIIALAEVSSRQQEPSAPPIAQATTLPSPVRTPEPTRSPLPTLPATTAPLPTSTGQQPAQTSASPLPTAPPASATPTPTPSPTPASRTPDTLGQSTTAKTGGGALPAGLTLIGLAALVHLSVRRVGS